MCAWDANYFSMAGFLINCDLGENETDAQTARLLECVDAANICCGVHAGSPIKTRATLELAKRCGVMVGAHPGLAVAGGRGRGVPTLSDFKRLLDEQLSFFLKSAEAVGVPVRYVKLHGSLYHAVESHEALAEVYVDGLLALGGGAIGMFSLSGGRCAAIARSRGIRVWQEIFADRGYLSDGRLVARGDPGAVLDVSAAIARFRQWLVSGEMPAVDGARLALVGDTVCVHSDSENAESILIALQSCR